MGFSRQEHWSGLPFSSPMHESEKWKWGCSVVSDSSQPHGLEPTRLLCPWDFPGKSTGVGCHHLLQLSVIHLLLNSFMCPTRRKDKQVETELGTEKDILQETRKNRQLMIKRHKIPNWRFSGNILDFFQYLCMWLHRFSYACGIFSCNSSINIFFSCSMQDLVPWPGIEPGPPHREQRVLASESPGKFQECLILSSSDRAWYTHVYMAYVLGRDI